MVRVIFRLELDTARELQLSRIGRVIGVGTARDRAALVDVAVRHSPVDVIEGVITICPELKRDLLTNGEVLLHSDICVEEVGPKGGVSSGSPDLIECGE